MDTRADDSASEAVPAACGTTAPSVTADLVYRFMPREQVYGGLRYNKANGTMAGIPGEVGADRWQVAGGWFVTPNVLMKAEYVTQEYNGFPLANIRHGGKFHGVMLEGVIGF
jgi:hypothetical protein